MAKKIHYTKEMKKCPYCGHDEFYIRQSYSGVCDYHYRYDGKIAYNAEMYDGSIFNDIRKYAYCSDCNKRLFLISEYYESLF